MLGLKFVVFLQESFNFLSHTFASTLTTIIKFWASNAQYIAS